MFAIFPNRRLTSACPKLSKRVQSAKQKTKFLGLPMPSAAKLMKSYANERRTPNEIVDFSIVLSFCWNKSHNGSRPAGAECSQTYLKLVQGVYARDNDRLSDKKRKPPRTTPDGFR